MLLFSLRRMVLTVGFILIGLVNQHLFAATPNQAGPDYQLFARSNLVALCIVSVEAKARASIRDVGG
jgi:hypothetical protein